MHQQNKAPCALYALDNAALFLAIFLRGCSARFSSASVVIDISGYTRAIIDRIIQLLFFYCPYTFFLFTPSYKKYITKRYNPGKVVGSSDRDTRSTSSVTETFQLAV